MKEIDWKTLGEEAYVEVLLRVTCFVLSQARTRTRDAVADLMSESMEEILYKTNPGSFMERGWVVWETMGEVIVNEAALGRVFGVPRLRLRRLYRWGLRGSNQWR